MFVGLVQKRPAERAHAGIDYSRWLAGAQLYRLEVEVTPELDQEDLSPAVVWGVFIEPSGKSLHVLVEGGIIGADYMVLLRATSTVRTVREDELLVRVEAL